MPPNVSINEAVDLAKRYSTDDSGRYVNGVLAAVAATAGRPARPDGPAWPPPQASSRARIV